MVCLITGIFTLTFSWNEPVNPQLLGMLPAQGIMNLACTTQLLGITGNAHFLPPLVTGEIGVMQFNPTTSFVWSEDAAKGSFREHGPPGLVTTPLCDPLIQDLRKRNSLVIPSNEENLIQLLRETIEDVFMFTPRVSAFWHGNTITITFHNYPSIDSCKFIKDGSPQYCTKNPCPMCSLCGVLISEGTEKVVTLSKCSFTPASRDVTALFLILP